MKTIVVGITGASGSIYGLRLIEELSKRGFRIHVVASRTALQVVPYETGVGVEEFVDGLNGQAILEDVENFFAAVASGSYKTCGMIVAPCSMGTLAGIASGISSNLLFRCADVCLKEKRPLILLARETPLSAINLENMLKLAKAGAMIFPASPGFYSQPKSISDMVDFMVGKVLDAIDVEHDLFARWGG